MPSDHLLSVDLGTSHTVAVVRWPDGRIRPLLFDFGGGTLDVAVVALRDNDLYEVLADGGLSDLGGLNARDGTTETLTESFTAYACESSDIRLGCFIEDGIQIYSFRGESS